LATSHKKKSKNQNDDITCQLAHHMTMY